MENKKILVTGGAGFIGSEFVRQAVKKGYKIVVIDKLTYAGSLKRLESVKGRYKFYKQDICNKKALTKIFEKENPDAVINFAAETHVDRSILVPKEFTKTNILGTHTLLEEARKLSIKRFVHVSCYDKNTRALTASGFKRFDELKKGDVAFSINPKTGNLEEKKIEKIIIQDYQGEMIHFRNDRIDLLTTPNHRMYYQKLFSKTNDVYFDEARNVFNKTGLILPKSTGWRGINRESIAIKGIGLINTCDLFYLSGLFIGDGFTAYQEKQVETRSGLNRKDFLKKARDKIGRFSAIKKESNYKTVCKSYRIFFDIPEKDKARQELETTLKKLKIKFSKHKGKSGEHIYFSSRYWINYFRQFGNQAKNKYIPRWMLKYDKKYLRHLFAGLIDSDGYRRKSDFQYTTVSDKLLSSIAELGYKLGYRAVFKRNKSKSYLKGRKIEGSAYYIYFSTQSKGIGKANAKKEHYKGKIWCAKVKDNKNLIVERNGKLDFCGNTDEVYGEIKQGKFKEGDPLAPNSPYSASKASADLLINAYIRTYNFPAIIVRPCNNYGKWQYPEKFIPVIITKALNDEKIPVYGKGENIREWLHISDCVRAIFAALEKGRLGEIYNVGSGQEMVNLDLVKKILDIMDKPHTLIEFVEDRLGHDYRYALDSSKINKLGFSRKVNFDQGLRNIIKDAVKKRPHYNYNCSPTDNDKKV